MDHDDQQHQAKQHRNRRHTVTVGRVGQESFDSTRRFSLTTLAGPRVRVFVHTAADHTATVAVAAKKAPCVWPRLAKGQRLNRRPSKAILDYILKTERFESRPYDDLGPGQGACTVGYGHVLHNSPCTGSEQSVTKAQAETLFQSDIAKAGAALAKVVRVDLDQNQYDAMLDFAFNAGLPRKVRDALNSCNLGALFAQMRIRVTSKGKTLKSLAARREYEIALFQK